MGSGTITSSPGSQQALAGGEQRGLGAGQNHDLRSGSTCCPDDACVMAGDRLAQLGLAGDLGIVGAPAVQARLGGGHDRRRGREVGIADDSRITSSPAARRRTASPWMSQAAASAPPRPSTRAA